MQYFFVYRNGVIILTNDRQFVVLGLGRFGDSVVRSLLNRGYHVLACDINSDVVQNISTYATHAVQVDVTDENAMSLLGIGNFDVVIVATGSSLESSTMATLIAKKLGANYVLAKAKNFMQKTILEKVGADKVVLPEWEMGIRVATNLVSSNVLDFINLSEEYSIAEIEPLSEWINLTLQKSNIRAKYGINVIAIKRDKKIIVPTSSEVIYEKDIIIAIGCEKDLQRLQGK